MKAIIGKQKLSDDTITISLIGRISDWKGQLLLINTVNRLINKEIKNIKILIVGSPHSSQKHLLEVLYNKIRTLNLEKYIEIQSFTSDIDKIYKKTDIIVVPSIRPEPFGLVAIEAMSAGLPVIASDDGGLREIVIHKKTGFLFKTGCEKDFEKYLIKLINNKEMRFAFGKNGKKRYSALFNLETYVNKIKEIIQKLLPANHST